MSNLVILLRQNVKDTIKCWRYGYDRPALWETRKWLQLVSKRQ